MGLLNPDARGISTDRLLNYINCYGEKAMIGYYDFQGLDIYIANELFAMTGFDKHGVPYFTFHSHEEDSEEADFFQNSQKQFRDAVLLRERMWIKENITIESINQIREALIIEKETGNNIIDQFQKYPESAISQGFIVNLGPTYKYQIDTNLISLVQRFCLTQEIKSYMIWYGNMNHAL